MARLGNEFMECRPLLVVAATLAACGGGVATEPTMSSAAPVGGLVQAGPAEAGSRGLAIMSGGGSSSSPSVDGGTPLPTAGRAAPADATTAGTAAQPAGAGAPAAAALANCSDMPGPAVVTDIHGTLSVEDYLDNIGNQTERPDAAAMLRAYAERGYFIIYVTGAPRAITAETERWFAEKGFPQERAILTLSEMASLSANVNRDYKIARLRRFADEGYSFKFGYGDKASDIEAYQAAGVESANIFTIAEGAGMLGTTAVDANATPEAAGYSEHLASYVSKLPALCTPVLSGEGLQVID
jgi:hypothetical protein